MNILKQYADKINGIFGTFDRMIINGYLMNLANYNQFSYYLHMNNVLLKDFDKFAETQTKSLCEHIEKYVKDNNCEISYLSSGKINKDEIARKEFDSNPNKNGLIACLATVEICNTMTVKPNHDTKKLEVTSKSTKCKHYYFYFNDNKFGWMYLKIQTWFPYNVQIYINGREYCSKLFDKAGIKYEMYNNSFSYIDDFNKAQDIANNILNSKMSDSFDELVSNINNHLPNIENILGCTYYWCVDQCEFATDINFKSREDLKLIYKTLVETSYFTFSSDDIYSFMGRNINYINKFKGEIVSDLRHWYQGYRIKFKLNNNQIKMYDKGNNLRIEVTINNPKAFKVLKTKTNDESGEIVETKQWVPMGKSISNLYRYVEISKNIINRFIEALPEIDIEKNVPVSDIESVSSSVIVKDKKYTGFNILTFDTLKLFSIISNAKYIINGFDNKLIRIEYFEKNITKKDINRLTRIFRKLKAHRLIKKVSRKNKYYLTSKGRKIINSILVYTRKQLLNNI